MFDQGVAQKVWVIDQYYATWAELGESQTESELLFTINCKRNRKETVNIVNNICSFSLLRPTPLHSTPLYHSLLLARAICNFPYFIRIHFINIRRGRRVGFGAPEWLVDCGGWQGEVGGCIIRAGSLGNLRPLLAETFSLISSRHHPYVGQGARFWLGFCFGFGFGSVRFGLVWFGSHQRRTTQKVLGQWQRQEAAEGAGSQALAQWQAETGKCFFTIKMMDDIINNVGVRPNRGFPVVVYFDINEIPLSFILSALIFGH